MKVTPQRKPHKVMTVQELKEKVEKLAGITKTPQQTLEEIAKKLQ